MPSRGDRNEPAALSPMTSQPVQRRRCAAHRADRGPITEDERRIGALSKAAHSARRVHMPFSGSRDRHLPRLLEVTRLRVQRRPPPCTASARSASCGRSPAAIAIASTATTPTHSAQSRASWREQGRMGSWTCEVVSGQPSGVSIPLSVTWLLLTRTRSLTRQGHPGIGDGPPLPRKLEDVTPRRVSSMSIESFSSSPTTITPASERTHGSLRSRSLIAGRERHGSRASSCAAPTRSPPRYRARNGPSVALRGRNSHARPPRRVFPARRAHRPSRRPSDSRNREYPVSLCGPLLAQRIDADP